MAYLLALETTTEVCSVAISQDDRLLHLEETHEPNQHGRLISVYMQRCLEAAGIDWDALAGIRVSSGPGSYTGLRVGTSAAKAVCYAKQIPLIEVDTLQSLARAMQSRQPETHDWWIPMIDARRMEVYLSVFDSHLKAHWPLQAKIIEADTFHPLLDTPDRRVLLAGNGAPKLKEIITDPRVHWLELGCSARWLIPLGFERWQQKNFEDTAYYRPRYLKPPNITRSKKKLL